jgi:hypothetical protein
MATRISRSLLATGGMLLATAGRLQAHGLHAEPAGTLHAALHALPLVAVLAAGVVTYQVVRAIRDR